jgi:hypothetical protein
MLAKYKTTQRLAIVEKDVYLCALRTEEGRKNN